jgi:tetratricopeptide (TPR) repeat protein
MNFSQQRSRRHHMARRPNLDNPLVAWRRAVRDLHRSERLAKDPRHDAFRDSIEIALFRVSARQREIVRRYDLAGEPAVEIQRALGISARQFFRDRRAALTELRMQLPYLVTPQSAVPVVFAVAPHPSSDASDATLSARARARSLAQTGNAQCLDVLRDLARNTSDASARSDLLLELAELALDFDDESTARDAVASVMRVHNDTGQLKPGLAEYFSARLARTDARLTEPYADAAAKLSEAVARLRRSLAASPNSIDALVALSDTLGDIAILDFEVGNFTSALAASAEAVRVIESFGLWTRPRALEIMAMDADIDACLSGHLAAAIPTVSSLLRRAVDSAWSATATRLGADLVGLYGTIGECGSALRWYNRMWPVALKGARPADRWTLMQEAAGSYVAVGRPREALAILSRSQGVTSCPSRAVPTRHAFIASSLLQLGENARALEEAGAALRGYAARCAGRGMGDAHRLLAKSYAKLGDLAAARERIGEARSLSERYGIPEGLLCTLNAQADILRSPTIKANALELEQFLRARART